MRVLVAGASGMIGKPLLARLEADGHDLVRMVRDTVAGPKQMAWSPLEGKLDSAAIEGFDAVISLSGDNIATGRWTAAKKQRIADSRAKPTRLLAETFANLKQPPKVWLCASATGIYGDRRDEMLTEQSAPGTGFLAEVCQAWEDAAAPSITAVDRIVFLRTSAVLDPSGGALGKMLVPFKLGLGGPAGTGRQYLSWISLADEIAAIEHLLTRSTLRGPVNLTSPQPLTNREFSKTLAHILHRPAFFKAPAAVLRLAFGEMAEATVLASARVLPEKLLGDGFVFSDATLEMALTRMLSR